MPNTRPRWKALVAPLLAMLLPILLAGCAGKERIIAAPPLMPPCLQIPKHLLTPMPLPEWLPSDRTTLTSLLPRRCRLIAAAVSSSL